MDFQKQFNLSSSAIIIFVAVSVMAVMLVHFSNKVSNEMDGLGNHKTEILRNMDI
jgi:uncharacterized protein YoxC